MLPAVIELVEELRLLIAKLLPPATLSSSGARSDQARLRSLPDKITLKLGQGREDVEYELARVGSGID